MTFLHPLLAVAGALSVAIPVIIHFFMRRRQKPIAWAAMRFLAEAFRKTRRRFQFEQIILLVCRCLVILLAATAIAGPLLAGGAQGVRGARTLYIVLDTSITGRAEDRSGEPALQRMKRLGLDLLDELNPALGDRVAILGVGAPAEPILMPPTSDLSTARRALEEAPPSDAGGDWAGVSALLRGAIADPGDGPAPDTVVAVLSEFRSGTLAGLQPAAPITGAGRLRVLAARPVQEAAANVAVIRAEPLRSLLIAGERDDATPLTTRVTLRRFGSASLTADTTPVALRLAARDDSPARTLAQRVAVWQPGQSEIEVSLAATLPPGTGWHAVEAASTPSDSIDADNIGRFVIEVREHLRVALIARSTLASSPAFDAADPADWVRAALQPASGGAGDNDLELQDLDSALIENAAMSGVSAAVVLTPGALTTEGWTRLARFADEGGVVIVFPDAEPGAQSWGDEFARAFALDWKIDAEPTSSEGGWRVMPPDGSPRLFASIAGDLQALTSPVRVTRRLGVRAGVSDSLIKMDDGSPLVAADLSRASEGRRGLVVFVSSAPSLTWSDLPARPFFLPLMQELIRQGASESSGHERPTAGERVRTGGADALTAYQTGRVYRADADGLTSDPIRLGGFFAPEGTGTLGSVAVSPAVVGSDTGLAPDADVASLLTGLGDPQFSWLGDGPADGERTYSGFAGAFRVDREPAVAALPLLVAALLLAAAEAVLARVFSHAGVSASPVREGTAA